MEPDVPPSRMDLSLPCEAATARLATLLARELSAGDTLLLSGPLGAGKTALARALIGARAVAGGLDPPEVPSPSYTLVQTYEIGDLTIWHVDLYRLGEAGELIELGLDEAFETALCLVEWPERLGPLAPADALHLALSHGAGDSAREAALTAPGPRARALLRRLEGTLG